MKIRDFDELPIATDGKVLVGASGTICTTDSNLSDIIGDLVMPATSGKVDKSTYAEDKAATEQELELLGGDLDSLDDKIDAVSGIVTSDYALSADVSTALTGKEDRVFVAEYNVTPYADIKDAYDAGKQIVLKHEAGPDTQYSRLVEYFSMTGYESFQFTCSYNTQYIKTYSCSKASGWSFKEKHYNQN